MFQDIMSYEYLILSSIVIAVVLPLVPNKKLRFYSCFFSFGTVVSLLCITLMPVLFLRPKNIANMKLAAYFGKKFSKILGIDWELRNGEVLKKDRGAIIVANHQSILDIMGMFIIWDVMDKCTAIAKKELLYWFPFGPCAWMAGLIFIDRLDPKTAKNRINASVDMLHKNKVKLWFYPEGTRNKNGNGILPFKKGAFTVAINNQVPIIPVVFSPYYFIDNKNKKFSEGKMIISVLDPISTEGTTISDINILTEKVNKLMSVEYEKLQRETSS